MYEVVCSVVADGDIPVHKYRSKKTGLCVYISEVTGPLVNGFFSLATEAFDDDGLPHILEHLIFLGSEDYPHKGVLDLLANRCLASGVHAWTATCHTRYWITNAGSQGFLCLLPVFLDHILYPTLTEYGYTTEVHHINGKGEDAGVVYCEIQAMENTGERRTHLEMLRALYPGHCGYRSETGGIMKNLRESTSHVKVCDYHKQFYRPENLSIIITGQIQVDDVFTVLQPFEDKIIAKAKLPEFVRPWQSPVPPLLTSVEKIVKYPADDETHGIVNIAMRGPLAKDQYSFNSVSLLLDYLSDSAISPLKRDFVEVSEPYCSNVEGTMIENSVCVIYFKFENVLTDKLTEIYPRLENVMRKIWCGDESLDMKRLSSLIHKKVQDIISSMEHNPHNKMGMCLIRDFLFGYSQQDFEVRVQPILQYTKMTDEPPSYWTGLIQKYFIDKHVVVILGQPSISLRKEYAEEEQERVKKQQEQLGKNGLQQKVDELNKAIKENEKTPPDSVFTSVNVPEVTAINFHPIVPFCNRGSSDDSAENGVMEKSLFPLDKIPFRFQLDDTHTNFVQVNILLDSTCVPQHLKYYLPLFCEVIFESAVHRDGVLIPHEDFISQLEKDTLCTTCCLGVKGGSMFSCGEYPQVVLLKMQVEKVKYEKGVTYLRDIFYLTKFEAERLKVVANRMNNAVDTYKRNGNSVMATLLKSLLYTTDCNHQVNSMFRQGRFLNGFLMLLDSQPDTVERNMEELRSFLTSPDNITIHMAVNVAQLVASVNQPHKLWIGFIPDWVKPAYQVCDMKTTFEYVVPVADCKTRSVIAGVGSVESSYLIQAVPCINSFLHDDLAAIEVFIQYLIQLEGPMWRQIRGLGLSYHYSIYVRPETGLLLFLLARSTDIVSAYKEAKNIVMGYVNSTRELTDVELEAAKGSLTFKIIEKEATVSDVSVESMLAYYKGTSHTYNRDMLRKISAVGISDLKRVGKKYMATLFDESLLRRAICCGPAKVSEVVYSMKEIGAEVEVVASLDESFLCSL